MTVRRMGRWLLAPTTLALALVATACGAVAGAAAPSR